MYKEDSQKTCKAKKYRNPIHGIQTKNIGHYNITVQAPKPIT